MLYKIITPRAKKIFKLILIHFSNKKLKRCCRQNYTKSLAAKKHTKEGYNIGNNRNGSFSKTMAIENVGQVVLNIPRDINAQFEPRIIAKGQTISSKIEEAILGMYNRAMKTADVCNQVKDIYGLDISETTVTNITERIMEVAKEWQQKVLEPVYFGRINTNMPSLYGKKKGKI